MTFDFRDFYTMQPNPDLYPLLLLVPADMHDRLPPMRRRQAGWVLVGYGATLGFDVFPYWDPRSDENPQGLGSPCDGTSRGLPAASPPTAPGVLRCGEELLVRFVRGVSATPFPWPSTEGLTRLPPDFDPEVPWNRRTYFGIVQPADDFVSEVIEREGVRTPELDEITLADSRLLAAINRVRADAGDTAAVADALDILRRMLTDIVEAVFEDGDE